MTYEIHAEFLKTASQISPDLVAALDHCGPLEQWSKPDLPFPRYLARAVAGQQLSVKAARSIWGRVETACQDIPLEDAFCEARAGVLRDCGLSGAKVKTLIAISDALKAGHLDPEVLAPMDPLSRAEHLTAIWGVGRWTADMANMFWFGEADIWPDGDVAARKTLEKLTSKRRKTVRTAAHFAPYRSYLARYMWAYVDAPPT